jgi:hypothetical protein
LTSTEGKDEATKEEFYSALEKVCDAVPNYDKKTALGDFMLKLEDSPMCIYIQHVDGTDFRTKQMLLENEW